MLNIDDEWEKLDSLPFMPFLHDRERVLDLSVRNSMQQRPTLRYFIQSSGKKYRIKELFMDWFYTGYPKSLMKSLVETYGNFETCQKQEFQIFYGKNYKGNDSISFYSYGTSVEVECLQNATIGEFEEIALEMRFGTFMKEKFKRIGFRERSFLARGGSEDWWEGKRISSMKWVDLNPDRNSDIIRGLSPFSTGFYIDGNKPGLRTVIFSDYYFNKAVWLEIFDPLSKMLHGAYNFRKTSGLFNYFDDKKGLLCFRSPEGPAAFQARIGRNLVTLAFSPGFEIEFINGLISDLDHIIENSMSLFM